MSVKASLGIFLSGFVVYGTVATIVGATKPRPVVGTARSALAIWIDPVAAARADSGSRLKAEFLLGDDGSKDYQLTFEPWTFNPYIYNVNYHAVNVYWDSQRNEECAFQPAADGVLRCLPTSAEQLYGPLGYLDAACTQLGVNFAAAQPGCQIDTPKYVTELDVPSGQSCSTPSGFYPAHFYQVGAFVGPNQPCYALNQGMCQAAGCPWGGQPSNSGAATYALGAEVPASAFVGSTPSHDP